MSPRWASAGVGAVRDADGVWRSRGDTEEFAAVLRDEGEEEAIAAFFSVDHNEKVCAALAALEGPRRKYSASDDDELLSPWELELELREATIVGLERKIAESEKSLSVLTTGKIVVRGKAQRLTQLRERLVQLKRELEEERATAQSFHRQSEPEIVHRRHIPTSTIRSRRPRDPKKIQ